jgi:hypothetical protein
MFETLDTMIALAVVYMILSMINKFILSGVKRLFKIKFIAMASELKTLASNNLLTIYFKEGDSRRDPDSTNFVYDYTETLKKIKLRVIDLRIFKLRLINKDTIRSITEFKTFIEAFLKREKVDEIAGYLNVDISTNDENARVAAKASALRTRDRIDAMYNSAMEQVSREYTKKMRYWAVAIGLLIAVTMNADFFVIYKSITSNATVRTKLVAKAEGISERVKVQHEEIMKALATDADPETVKEIIDSSNEGISKLTGEVEDAGLKLGWEHETWPGYEEASIDPEDKDKTIEAHWPEGKRLNWTINKIIGLIASAFLIGFGAPFWHDLLTSLVGIKKVLRGKGAESETATTTNTGN